MIRGSAGGAGNSNDASKAISKCSRFWEKLDGRLLGKVIKDTSTRMQITCIIDLTDSARKNSPPILEAVVESAG